jgi:hypothetical protein
MLSVPLIAPRDVSPIKMPARKAATDKDNSHTSSGSDPLAHDTEAAQMAPAQNHQRLDDNNSTIAMATC